MNSIIQNVNFKNIIKSKYRLTDKEIDKVMKGDGIDRKVFSDIKRQHLSVIYDKNETIISVGWSENITHQHMYSIHSEYDCLKKFEKKLTLGLINVKNNKFNMINMAFTTKLIIKRSDPCLLCCRNLLRYKNYLSKLLFTTSDKHIQIIKIEDDMCKNAKLSMGQKNVMGGEDDDNE